MDGFEEYLLLRNTESCCHTVYRCDECKKKKPDVDLWAEDPATGEQIFLCTECREEEERHLVPIR